MDRGFLFDYAGDLSGRLFFGRKGVLLGRQAGTADQKERLEQCGESVGIVDHQSGFDDKAGKFHL